MLNSCYLIYLTQAWNTFCQEAGAGNPVYHPENREFCDWTTLNGATQMMRDVSSAAFNGDQWSIDFCLGDCS